MQRSLVTQVFGVLLYLIGSTAVIYAYTLGWHYHGFYLSTSLIAIGLFITVSSILRYRQRLNYVEGLERALSDQDLGHSSRQTILRSHWIDHLGDRGVGVINILLILVAVPGVLGHASLLPELALFEEASVESHGFGFGTWVAFVALESIGVIRLIFDLLGLERLTEVAALGERFSEPWRWFMAMVQVGLLSLAFDIFRRYLDLSTMLGRFASTIALSGIDLSRDRVALQNVHLDSSYEVDEKFNHYLNQRGESFARVETLTRFLTVFPKRRIISKINQVVQHPKAWRLDATLDDEGRSLLLIALTLAGMRTGHSLSLKVAQNTAFELLNQNSSLTLRITALDVLSGLYARRIDEIPYLSDEDQKTLLSVAREQLRIGSAYAISTKLSIEYERLALAASFALSVSHERRSLLPLFTLKFSDSKVLSEEADYRLHKLLKRLDQYEIKMAQTLLEMIEVSSHHDEVKTEECLFKLMALTENTGDKSSKSESNPLLNQSMIQMTMSRVAHASMGVGVLRTMVRELGRLNVDWAGQSIWSLLTALESEESRFGLVEGIQTNQSLTQVVHLHLIKTLTHGLPHEVEQALRVCRLLTANELSMLPILTLHEIERCLSQLCSKKKDVVAHKRLIPQLQNLSIGLAKMKVSAKHQASLQSTYERLELMDEIVLTPIKGLFKATKGEEEALSSIFQSYLQTLSLRRLGQVVTQPEQMIARDIIERFDPSIVAESAKWERILFTYSQAEAQIDLKEANMLASSLVPKLVTAVTPIKFLWLLQSLSDPVHAQLKSSILQRLITRLKFLEHMSLAPLFNRPPLEWLFDYTCRRIRSESQHQAMRQWIRLLTHLMIKLKSPRYIEEGISILKQIIEGKEIRVRSELRGLAAEQFGQLCKVRPKRELSQYLVDQLQEKNQPQSIINGICRGLRNISDDIAKYFFIHKARGINSTLTKTAFVAMVECLDKLEEYEVLASLCTRLEELQDEELIALCGSLMRQADLYKKIIDQRTKNLILNYALGRLREASASEKVQSACVDVLPMTTSSDDQETCDLLFQLLSSMSRQTLFYRLTQVIAEIFPTRYQQFYQPVLSELSSDLKPKWIMGWAKIDPVKSQGKALPTEFMISELVHWLSQIEGSKGMNVENILSLSTQLLIHGQGDERGYVYRWMKASRYRHIAYAIVKRVKESGRREQDIPLLKDELNRLHSRAERRLRIGGKAEDENLEEDVKFEIELLDALAYFGQTDAHLALINFAVKAPNGHKQRRLQQLALTKLSDALKDNLGIDESIE